MKRSYDIASFVAHGGFGFYWAWVAIAFYSSAPVAYSPIADGIIEAFWQYSTMAHGAALLLCALMAPRMRYLARRTGAPIVSGLALSLGMLLLTILGAHGDGQVAPVALISVSVIVGVASSLQFLMWGEVYARMGISEMTACSLFSFGMGLVLYFVLADFPMVIVSTIASTCLPLASMTCIVICLRRSPVLADGAEKDCSEAEAGFPETTSNPSSAWEQIPRLLDSAILVAALFAFAFGGEILRGLSVALSNAPANIMGAFYLFGGVVGMFGLVCYWLAPFSGNSPRRITMRVVRVVLIIMAAAFLAIPLVSSYSIAVGYGIFGAGFWCFRAISWVYCFLFIKRFSTNPLRALGILDGTFALSVVVSAPVNELLVSNLRQSGVTLTTSALVIALVLMFIVVFVLYNRQSTTVLNAYESRSDLPAVILLESGIGFDTAPIEHYAVGSAADGFSDCVRVQGGGVDDADRPNGSGADIETAYEERMRAVKAAYGLTDREAEVARLMAQGRSLPFIQEALYISAGTAQTHSRRIYKKLGIHSRQELIDVVNSVR